MTFEGEEEGEEEEEREAEEEVEEEERLLSEELFVQPCHSKAAY